jgi:hypothetical protein
MAITTSTELQTAIKNWTQRADLDSRLPEFIAMVEAKFNRELRVIDQETKLATFTIGGEYVAQPTDFLQVKTFYLNSPKRNLNYYASDLITSVHGSATNGSPENYSLEGANFRFGPFPSSTGTVVATLVYAAKVISLTATSVNWVLLSHPDVYLYGCLLESDIFAKDTEAAKLHGELFLQSIDRLKAWSDRKANRAPDAMVADTQQRR